MSERTGPMQTDDRPNRSAAILAEVRRTTIALTAFVGSFWMAGLLF